MSDLEVARAIRVLNRTDFEGISLETLQKYKTMINKAIANKIEICNHDWQLYSNVKISGIFIKTYECQLCKSRYAKGG